MLFLTLVIILDSHSAIILVEQVMEPLFCNPPLHAGSNLFSPSQTVLLLNIYMHAYSV